jgi:hypothetical protein
LGSLYESLSILFIIIIIIRINFFRHFINKDFKLKSYLLTIKNLKDIHSSKYMNSVLLEALEDFGIEYNITR